MLLASLHLSLFAQKCMMEQALSVSSDESEAPGEANVWHWLFELAYHHEFGGALLESWVWTSAARLSASCMFAVMVAPMPRASVEKFTFVPARALSQRPVAFHEAASFRGQRPSVEGRAGESACRHDVGWGLLISIVRKNVFGLMQSITSTRDNFRAAQTCFHAVPLNLLEDARDGVEAPELSSLSLWPYMTCIDRVYGHERRNVGCARGGLTWISGRLLHLPLRFAFMAPLPARPVRGGSCLSRHRAQCAGAEIELLLGTVSAHFDLIS